jgi:hypothetical protein
MFEAVLRRFGYVKLPRVLALGGIQRPGEMPWPKTPYYAVRWLLDRRGSGHWEKTRDGENWEPIDEAVDYRGLV